MYVLSHNNRRKIINFRVRCLSNVFVYLKIFSVIRFLSNWFSIRIVISFELLSYMFQLKRKVVDRQEMQGKPSKLIFFMIIRVCEMAVLGIFLCV